MGQPLRREARNALSAGEVHFLWWFMQGSIMEPETRHRLRLAWGMCKRHTLGALGAEAAFRHGYLHGSAILYEDLMERATHAIALGGPLAGPRVARRLRSVAACHMCQLGYGADSQSFIPWTRVEQGRDLSWLRAFLVESRPHWISTVCGRCSRNGSPVRCRLHLLDDLRDDPLLALDAHRGLVDTIYRRVRRYSASFQWELQGSDTAEDRSGLASAAGWCGGWDLLLQCADE